MKKTVIKAMALKTEAEFIYEDFVLHTAPEKFYLEPLQAPNEVLVIDRSSKDITLESKYLSIPSLEPSRGVLGC